MTDRPILFSAPMVRALVDGRKTQTRRILNPQPFPWAEAVELGPYDGYGAPGAVVQRTLDNRKQMGLGVIRFAPGDRLWVREQHALIPPDGVRYAATDDIHELRKKRPSIHMPRWASRLTLSVTDVRVERLHAISDADALAEGVQPTSDGSLYHVDHDHHAANPATSFMGLWTSINGPESWLSNPWVIAVTFTVEHRNIDA